MHRLNHGSFFAIYLDNPNDYAPCVDIERLWSLLPHGSGIDGDYHIRVFKNGSVHVYGDWHSMNEDGYYTGWTPFTVTLIRCKADRKRPLGDGGFYQLCDKRGDILLNVNGGGDVSDYLFDVMLESLAPLLTRRKIANDCFSPNGKPATWDREKCCWVEA